MKKTNFFKKLCMLGLAAALVGTSVDASMIETQAASKLTLSAKKLTVAKGKKVTLKVKAKGVKATFKSNKPKVAAVSSKKAASSVKITGKSVGTATITATSGKKKATCKVTVVTAVKKVSLNAKKAVLGFKKSMQLVADVTPANATQAVTWKTSNKKIATVNKKGKVTTKKKAGKVKITATATDGTKKKATVTITVKKKVTLANKVTLDATAKTITAGQTATLKATVSAKKAKAKVSNTNIYWTTSNKAVATVNQKGVVTAVKAGTATITAQANDGSKKKATATITVTAPAGNTPGGNTPVNPNPGPKPDDPKPPVEQDVATTGITLDQTELKFTTIDKDQIETLVATVAPENATDKTVTWTSSDETIATVADGVVTVKANTPASKKTATITATAKGGQTATCTVQVIGKNNAIVSGATDVVFTLDKNADAASLTKGDKTIEKLQAYIEAKVEDAKSKDYILNGTDAADSLNKAWSKLVSRSSDGVEVQVEDVDANTKNVTVSFNGRTETATLVKGTNDVTITSGNRVVLVKDITVNEGTVTFKVDVTVDGEATVTDKVFTAVLTVENDLYSATLTTDGNVIASCVESEDDIVVTVNKGAANKVFEALGSSRTIDSVLSDVSAFNIYK